jgi:hypothetical protein
MTRQQKATALQAIKDGRLKPSDLLPPVNYLVYHETDGYRYNDETITPDQYRQLVATFEEEAARRDAVGLPAGHFYTIEYAPGPVNYGKPLTMDLSR